MENNKEYEITFQVSKKVDYGSSVYLTGSLSCLGSWNPFGAVRLHWTKGDVWQSKIKFFGLRNKTSIEYKYFISESDIQKDSSVVWEIGQNRTVKVSYHKGPYRYLEDTWGYFKVVFRFWLDTDAYQMYITGEPSSLGFSIGRPSKMKLRIIETNFKKNYLPMTTKDSIVNVWESEFLIPSNTEHLIYRYGVRNKKKSEIVWEREPYRFCNLKDFRFQKNGYFDRFNEAMGLKQKQTIYFKFRNSSYKIIDSVFVTDLVYSKINDEVACGPYPYYSEISSLKDKGFKALLNLQSADGMERLGYSSAGYEENCDSEGVVYVKSVVESTEESHAKQCLTAVMHLKSLAEKYKQVYVFCSEGVNRSPVVVMLYLHLVKNYDIWMALKVVKKRRYRCLATKEMLQLIIDQYGKTCSELRGVGSGEQFQEREGRTSLIKSNNVTTITTISPKF